MRPFPEIHPFSEMCPFPALTDQETVDLVWNAVRSDCPAAFIIGDCQGRLSGSICHRRLSGAIVGSICRQRL
jgi:hypothetical protein